MELKLSFGEIKKRIAQAEEEWPEAQAALEVDYPPLTFPTLLSERRPG